MQKTMNPRGLFSLNEHLATVEDDMLEKLYEIVNFEIFREICGESWLWV